MTCVTREAVILPARSRERIDRRHYIDRKNSTTSPTHAHRLPVLDGAWLFTPTIFSCRSTGIAFQLSSQAPHYLRGKLEAEVHPRGANMKKKVARGGRGVVRAANLAERVQLFGTRRSE